MAVNLPAGPEAWRHWLALKEGLPRGAAWEFVLYTDAWLTGGPEFQAGPFQIFNTVPARIPAEMAPAVVVRADSYLPPPEIPAMGQTNVETWLGLSLDDEIAVLLSLALGARLRGGGLIREFEQDADPRGRPVEYLHRPPTWTPPSGNQFMLPGLLGGHRSLDEAVSHLNRLPATPGPGRGRAGTRSPPVPGRAVAWRQRPASGLVAAGLRCRELRPPPCPSPWPYKQVRRIHRAFRARPSGPPARIQPGRLDRTPQGGENRVRPSVRSIA
jgi:hypothetical protein